MTSRKIFLPERAAEVDRWFRGELPFEIIKQNNGRMVWRAGSERPRLFVKRFPPSLFRDRALAEARMLQELQAARIPCPRVVATARDSRGTYLITEEICDAPGLMDILREGGPDARRGLTAFGSLLRRLHDLGFDHRDLHAGNLLVGSAGIFVLDVHRASRSRSLPQSARHRGLAFAAMSLRDRLPLTETLRFLRAYGVVDHEEIRKILAGLRRRMEEHFRNRQARCVREGTGFGVRDGLYYRKGIDPDQLLREIDSGPETIVKESSKERLSRLPSGRFIRRTTPRRALVIWKNAHALGVRGIPTPRLDACGRGWVVGEWIDALDLRHFCRDRWISLPREKRGCLLSSIAVLVRRMHAMRVFHEDLNGANFLAARGGLHVLDPDRVRIGPRISRGERIRNLAQLNASMDSLVSRSDRLRFFRLYAGRDAALWQQRKSWISEILRR